MPLGEDVVLEEIAKLLEGFVGSDIEALCREAGLIALREDIKATTAMHKHFIEARDRVHATMTPQAQEYYEKMEAELKTDQRLAKERITGFV
jgi:transitional endoplasmic reticulum ATPase